MQTKTFYFKSRKTLFSFIAAFGLCVNPGLTAEKAAPLSLLTNIPIKEVTVFKDGHAFVVHEGSLPVNDQGNAVVDSLPAPVLGTFWPYSLDKRAKLIAVVAGQRRVSMERSALNLREILEANIGAQGYFNESNGKSYAATIVGIPSRSSEELAATGLPGADERLPEQGNIIILKTSEGIKAMNLDRIVDATFTHGHKLAASHEQFRHLLTLQLDWGQEQPGRAAQIGLIYLQKGIRWIPSYKLSLDGHGKAMIKLEATLLNELADLHKANVNLVVGVPTFQFKDSLDPMALQQTAAQLSQFFQTNPRPESGQRVLLSNFSNSIMTQAMRTSDYRAPGESNPSLGPEIPDASKQEDLFIFSLKNISLKKGERMVVPIVEYELTYSDVYTLELPFTPPSEVQNRLNSSQQEELARLFSAPKIMHKIRLNNQSAYPLTTAPVLILRDGRILAQGLMTYTAIGGKTDVPITVAIDIQVKKTESEKKRTPDALRHDNNHYTRVDLKGAIHLANYRSQTVDLEITRFVLGNAESVGQNGKIEKINVFESNDFMRVGEQPYWWHWYGWPSWWSQFNGVGKMTWKLNLKAGDATQLDYEWHYFWR